MPGNLATGVFADAGAVAPPVVLIISGLQTGRFGICLFLQLRSFIGSSAISTAIFRSGDKQNFSSSTRYIATVFHISIADDLFVAEFVAEMVSLPEGWFYRRLRYNTTRTST
jgi:hypothetical protein